MGRMPEMTPDSVCVAELLYLKGPSVGNIARVRSRYSTFDLRHR